MQACVAPLYAGCEWHRPEGSLTPATFMGTAGAANSISLPTYVHADSRRCGWRQCYLFWHCVIVSMGATFIALDAAAGTHTRLVA
jgi:hypothetical protein